ncbi:hypothetical protein [Metamycoplasma neophronis]|uniref:Uncharacterized protein n=1 Tax=Metamycoplasma neophronis TaxID=872983 RepID=A0ABY2Z0K9_9BACT|nr:hypothetical protein [Metamycoplasma neophronis]TPR54300.1 hypothetical protein FJR74_00775 [Metamycoplasma neophronis]
MIQLSPGNVNKWVYIEVEEADFFAYNDSKKWNWNKFSRLLLKKEKKYSNDKNIKSLYLKNYTKFVNYALKQDCVFYINLHNQRDKGIIKKELQQKFIDKYLKYKKLDSVFKCLEFDGKNLFNILFNKWTKNKYQFLEKINIWKNNIFLETNELQKYFHEVDKNTISLKERWIKNNPYTKGVINKQLSQESYVHCLKVLHKNSKNEVKSIEYLKALELIENWNKYEITNLNKIENFSDIYDSYNWNITWFKKNRIPSKTLIFDYYRYLNIPMWADSQTLLSLIKHKTRGAKNKYEFKLYKKINFLYESAKSKFTNPTYIWLYNRDLIFTFSPFHLNVNLFELFGIGEKSNYVNLEYHTNRKAIIKIYDNLIKFLRSEKMFGTEIQITDFLYDIAHNEDLWNEYNEYLLDFNKKNKHMKLNKSHTYMLLCKYFRSFKNVIENKII